MLLTEKQKNRIHTNLASGNFNVPAEVQHLVEQGFSEGEAALKIKEEIGAYRQRLFDQKIEKEKGEEYEKLAYALVVMVAILGPIMGIGSFVWYLAACAIAGGIGYWAFKDKPLAGLAGSICAVIMLPPIYEWYVSGRESIIKIEMLIPVGLALVPSYLVGYLVYITFYSNKN
ncbi:hypothetical protein [Cytophaga aurantiaca]|uniref:hypothetical protein n=1 Tax=Cytophaga aurantiaca TaxID=29530 RepID=UPI00036CE3A3|nr:hypothetical protein [Cytophaga aurantiaca]